ncbi:MAG: hypothetical protein J6A33_05430 [Alphaproteobacteria bacterium]|nr:hypothetical protein [Alphaproteobacteria bacterium]
MAFNSKDFSVMAYANGFTLWNYASADKLAAVKGTGYFNETAPFVCKGDMILTVANKEAAIESAILSVENVGDGSVSVSDMTTAAVSTPAS